MAGWLVCVELELHSSPVSIRWGNVVKRTGQFHSTTLGSIEDASKDQNLESGPAWQWLPSLAEGYL